MFHFKLTPELLVSERGATMGEGFPNLKIKCELQANGGFSVLNWCGSKLDNEKCNARIEENTRGIHIQYGINVNAMGMVYYNSIFYVKGTQWSPNS